MPVSKLLKKRILEALACSSDKCLSRKELQKRVNVSLDTLDDALEELAKDRDVEEEELDGELYCE